MRSLVLALCLMAGSVLASPRESIVVDAAWLATHLKDPNLVLLHVGDKADYAAKHIPGARHVALADLRQRLENLGISNDSRVIVYYGKDWVSPTTRVIFTLDYAGLGDHASLLDGGMDAWIAAGNKVVDVVPEPKKGTLAALKLKPIVVTGDQVRERMGKKGFAIVDGRSASLYDGIETGGMPEHPHKTGHIAGAGSVPFSEVVDDKNQVKSADELKALFAKAGVKPGDTVIAYCHIGQQATATLFAARSLGYPVLLYDGSFEDWSRREDAPAENPSAKKEQK